MVVCCHHGESWAKYNLAEPIPLQVEHVAVEFGEPFRPSGPCLRTMKTSAQRCRVGTSYFTRSWETREGRERLPSRKGPKDLYGKEVSWYFEPSQPQRITSRLECSICLLFTLHASHQTTDYPETTKLVPTQTHIKQNNNKIHKHQTQNFRRISPFELPLLKKHTRRGHAGIVDHSVDLSIPDFFKVEKKGMDRSNETLKKQKKT